MAVLNPHGEAVLNQLGAPMSCATNEISGSPHMPSGSRGRRGFGRSVGSPTSVASPRNASVSRLPFWLGRAAERSLVPVRVVAQNKQTDNNGLEQTGSAANGPSGPCSSTQC